MTIAVGTPSGYAVRTGAGEQISSTFEGRHVMVLESLLTHVNPGDALVDKGQPILCTDLVGVALQSAKANTDKIPIDTEGIWYLSVVGAGAIAVGQHLFITAAGLITAVNLAASRHFGYALQSTSEAGTIVIAVKVHWSAPVVPAG